ncbi:MULTISPECIES: DUF3662 domain-containing protein [unclassified Streptomyces]|uniref:DUF3662 domain-containing protein n=1 Tax=unclassified Streptomyces TaxID=2593676 RepID=UPI00332B5D66
MGHLKRWEQALERWQDDLLGKVFHRDPVELVDALRGECDTHAVVCSQSRVVVPNAYEIELTRSVHKELLRRVGEVGRALTDSLARHGETQGYEWAGPLTVRVTTSSEQLPNGRYRVASRAMPHVRADAFPSNPD